MMSDKMELAADTTMTSEDNQIKSEKADDIKQGIRYFIAIDNFVAKM